MNAGQLEYAIARVAELEARNRFLEEMGAECAQDWMKIERLVNRIGVLERVLRRFSNEVKGLVHFERAIREAIGNTNWECLNRHVGDADSILLGSQSDGRAEHE
jgi:hypothetical protein